MHSNIKLKKGTNVTYKLSKNFNILIEGIVIFDPNNKIKNHNGEYINRVWVQSNNKNISCIDKRNIIKFKMED